MIAIRSIVGCLFCQHARSTSPCSANMLGPRHLVDCLVLKDVCNTIYCRLLVLPTCEVHVTLFCQHARSTSPCSANMRGPRHLVDCLVLKDGTTKCLGHSLSGDLQSVLRCQFSHLHFTIACMVRIIHFLRTPWHSCLT